MRYLITHKGFAPFLTEWFDYENSYIEGMVVYDLHKNLYSEDGLNWQEINFDHL